MEVQVGDRVTFNNKDKKLCCQIISNDKQFTGFYYACGIDEYEVLKIERIGKEGWYTVYEEEMLTKEEKELLKTYIKWIKSLNNGDIVNLYKQACWIVVNLKTQLDYSMEVGARFEKLVENKRYTLSKLGLED